MSARDLSLIPRGVPSEGEIRRRPEETETETVQQFFYTASVEFILSGFLFPLLILWFLFEQVAALAFWASRTGDILLAPVLGAFPLLVFVYYLTFQIVVSSVYAWHRWPLKASVCLLHDRLQITPISSVPGEAISAVAQHTRSRFLGWFLNFFSSRRGSLTDVAPIRMHEIAASSLTQCVVQRARRACVCWKVSPRVCITYSDAPLRTETNADQESRTEKQLWIESDFFRSPEAYAEVLRWIEDKVGPEGWVDSNAELRRISGKITLGVVRRECGGCICRSLCALVQWCVYCLVVGFSIILSLDTSPSVFSSVIMIGGVVGVVVMIFVLRSGFGLAKSTETREDFDGDTEMDRDTPVVDVWARSEEQEQGGEMEKEKGRGMDVVASAV